MVRPIFRSQTHGVCVRVGVKRGRCGFAVDPISPPVTVERLYLIQETMTEEREGAKIGEFLLAFLLFPTCIRGEFLQP